MDTYLRSALERYKGRPNAHYARNLKTEMRRVGKDLTLEDAQKIMAVAYEADPQERDTLPGIRTLIREYFPGE